MIGCVNINATEKMVKVRIDDPNRKKPIPWWRCANDM